MITRPDVATAVVIACSKSAKPTQADWNAAIRILRYLLHSADRKLTYTSPPNDVATVSTYVDAAWANAPKAKSRYGYIISVFGNPVLWKSKTTTMVCLSTAEAEYYAAVEASKSSLWLANLVTEITSVPISPVTLFEDNAACITMATNPIVSARNRHFSMRMWWLREQVESGAIVFVQVPTKSQIADIFTKVLPTPVFLLLCKFLFAPTSLYYFQ